VTSTSASNKVNLRNSGSVVDTSSNSAPRGFNNQKTLALKKKTDDFKIAEMRIKLSSKFQGGVIGGLNALCPSGFIPMSSAVLSDSSKGRAISQLNDFGAVVSAPSSLAGAKLKSQLVCLKDNLKPFTLGTQYWGSAKANTVNSSKKSFHFFGGPGNDKFNANGDDAHVFGGTGKDIISMSGADSVAIGGAGNDHLIAKGKKRILLVGGDGEDILTGNKGPTVLDARDGMGDDIVNCSGSLNVAITDPGDKVTGTCKLVIPAN
jgi:hypothetical protein